MQCGTFMLSIISQINKICILAFTAGILFLLIEPHAHAIGVGIYVKGEGDYCNASWKDSRDSSTSMLYTGIGLVLDTNAAKDELMNYRLSIGYDTIMYGHPPYFGGGNNYKISFAAAFGYGFYRNERVRLWVGPRIGISYVYDSRRIGTGEINSSLPFALQDSMFYLIASQARGRMRMALIQPGCVFGVNINPGKVVTVSLETGINIIDIGIGTYNKKVRGIGTTFMMLSSNFIPYLKSSY